MLGLVRANSSLARPSARPERWDPWSDMSRMRAEMDDLVTRAFGFTPLSQLSGEGAIRTSLPMELWETEGQYRLRAFLPGISREDINLETTVNHVTLWGERRAQSPEDAKLLFGTAAYGNFRFEYEFPMEVNPDQVTATYRDGVLEVTLPKVESAKARSVKVNIEG